ncbi:MAG: hypothetical protein JO160_01055, partial [Candidatus Eremiobacteraeota bacterium]|nr:hypothetical protein [Candidatus Eremiobacteraeota bacterium]
AGCDAVVSVREAQNVVTRFDDVLRRPLLPAACKLAPLDRLSIVRADVVVAGKPGTLHPPHSVLIQPAKPARDWAILPTGSYRQTSGGIVAWSWSGLTQSMSREPQVKITAQQACFPWLRLRAHLAGASMNVVDVGDLKEYSLPPNAAGDGHAVVHLEDVARRFQIPETATLTGIDGYGLAPGSLAAPCRITAAAVSSDALPGDLASITIDGRRFAVPRDGRPHGYPVVLTRGRHRIELGHAMEIAGLFRSGVLVPPQALPADLQRLETDVAAPGWVVYSQPADSLWHGTVAGMPLQQHRADLDLQAYELQRPGRLRVELPIAGLRVFAEIVTWATLILTALWALWAELRWRRA